MAPIFIKLVRPSLMFKLARVDKIKYRIEDIIIPFNKPKIKPTVLFARDRPVFLIIKLTTRFKSLTITDKSKNTITNKIILYTSIAKLGAKISPAVILPST